MKNTKSIIYLNAICAICLLLLPNDAVGQAWVPTAPNILFASPPATVMVGIGTSAPTFQLQLHEAAGSFDPTLAFTIDEDCFVGQIQANRHPFGNADLEIRTNNIFGQGCGRNIVIEAENLDDNENHGIIHFYTGDRFTLGHASSPKVGIMSVFDAALGFPHSVLDIKTGLDGLPANAVSRYYQSNAAGWNQGPNDTWTVGLDVPDNFSFKFSHNDNPAFTAPVMTLTQDADVGIGTTAPTAMLDITNGATRIQAKTDAAATLPWWADMDYGIYSQTASDGGGFFAWDQGGSDHADMILWYGDDFNSDLRFMSSKWNGGLGVMQLTDVMILTANNLVGIGNTNPNSALHVGTTSGVGSRISLGSVESIEDGGLNIIMTRGGHLTTSTDCAWDLGTSAIRWNQVWACNGTIQTSDRNDKDNIHALDYGLNEILQLNPVTFTWKDRPQDGVKLGLLAQDVQQVLSEVVVDSKTQTRYDEEGNVIPHSPDEESSLGIYYSDIIPVLIKGMQEQQEIIEAQSADIESVKAELARKDEQIAELNKLVRDIANHIGGVSVPESDQNERRDQPQLMQNMPNPFSEATTIRYYIPSSGSNASIVVSTMTGRQMLRFPVSGGHGSVRIAGGELQSGTYLYSLIVDGREIDSKVMTLVE